MRYLKSIASTTKAWFKPLRIVVAGGASFCDFVYKGLVQTLRVIDFIALAIKIKN